MSTDITAALNAEFHTWATTTQFESDEAYDQGVAAYVQSHLDDCVCHACMEWEILFCK